MIRPNWRSIKWKALTDEERAVAEPELERMAAEARAAVLTFAARSRAAFADPVAQPAEIAAPKGFERTSPERMRELNERLGYREEPTL